MKTLISNTGVVIFYYPEEEDITMRYGFVNIDKPEVEHRPFHWGMLMQAHDGWEEFEAETREEALAKADRREKNCSNLTYLLFILGGDLAENNPDIIRDAFKDLEERYQEDSESYQFAKNIFTHKPLSQVKPMHAYIKLAEDIGVERVRELISI